MYATFDITWAIYRRYESNTDIQKGDVSYIAHMSGAIAGLLIGIIVLKNRKVHAWEIRLKILCIIIFALFVGGCAIWNIFGEKILETKYFQPSELYNYYPHCNGTVIF